MNAMKTFRRTIGKVMLISGLFAAASAGTVHGQGKSPVQGPQDSTIVAPLPLPTFDVDTPALQPFRATSSRDFTAQNSLTFNEIVFNPVPNGKRLAVTFASYLLRMEFDPPLVETTGSCSLGVRDPGGPGVSTFFSLPVSIVDSPAGVVAGTRSRRIMAGSPVTLYAEEGELVEFSCNVQSDPPGADGNLRGSISGYFIDVE